MADGFEGGDASSSGYTYPQRCSTLRKKGFVMLVMHPCEIVEMSTSKTGKHGHAKVHFVGNDIFTGMKYDDIFPSTQDLDVPRVTRMDYRLTNIEDGDFLLLMDNGGETRSDLQMPGGELGDTIRNMFDDGANLSVIVRVVKAMGKEKINAVKTKV